MHFIPKLMKYMPKIQLAFSVAFLAALPAVAQSPSVDTASALNLDSPAAPSRNRVGLSYRMGFNVPLSFRHLGGYPALSFARYTPFPDNDRYNYDNGYVLRDSSASGQFTRYWGYDNASQVPGDGTIIMQQSSSVATASSKDHYETPMSGVELTYNRELIRKKSWRGGLEGAFGYTYMSIDDAGLESSTVTRVADTYSFAAGPGTIVPPAPYYGHFVGQPGDPVLVFSPTHTVTTEIAQGAQIMGQRDFSADLFGFRIGPYVEIPLSKSIALTLGGGFAAMYVSSDFSFNETVTIPGVGSVNNVGSGSHSDWQFGGYAAGNLSLALSERWAVMAGAQFMNVGQYTHTVNGKEAKLDLRQAIFVTVGLSYSF
jgi:hypothetical protein